MYKHFPGFLKVINLCLVENGEEYTNICFKSRDSFHATVFKLFSITFGTTSFNKILDIACSPSKWKKRLTLQYVPKHPGTKEGSIHRTVICPLHLCWKWYKSSHSHRPPHSPYLIIPCLFMFLFKCLCNVAIVSASTTTPSSWHPPFCVNKIKLLHTSSLNFAPHFKTMPYRLWHFHPGKNLTVYPKIASQFYTFKPLAFQRKQSSLYWQQIPCNPGSVVVNL